MKKKRKKSYPQEFSAITTEALKRLRKAQESEDIGIAHSQADKVLCELLSCVGFENVVIEYGKVQKWYA